MKFVTVMSFRETSKIKKALSAAMCPSRIEKTCFEKVFLDFEQVLIDSDEN